MPGYWLMGDLYYFVNDAVSIDPLRSSETILYKMSLNLNEICSDKLNYFSFCVVYLIPYVSKC